MEQATERSILFYLDFTKERENINCHTQALKNLSRKTVN